MSFFKHRLRHVPEWEEAAEFLDVLNERCGSGGHLSVACKGQCCHSFILPCGAIFYWVLC